MRPTTLLTLAGGIVVLAIAIPVRFPSASRYPQNDDPALMSTDWSLKELPSSSTLTLIVATGSAHCWEPELRVVESRATVTITAYMRTIAPKGAACTGELRLAPMTAQLRLPLGHRHLFGCDGSPAEYLGEPSPDRDCRATMGYIK